MHVDAHWRRCLYLQDYDKQGISCVSMKHKPWVISVWISAYMEMESILHFYLRIGFDGRCYSYAHRFRLNKESILIVEDFLK